MLYKVEEPGDLDKKC